MRDLSYNQGRTVLFVSHNIAAVESLCNKGIILEHGKVFLAQSPVAQAVEAYKGLLGVS